MPNTKRTGGVAQGVGPEFKPQYHQNKTKKQPFVPFKKHPSLEKHTFTGLEWKDGKLFSKQLEPKSKQE
jgi:hypothetical protein